MSPRLPALVAAALLALVAISIPACERLRGRDDPPRDLDARAVETIGGIDVYRDVLYRTVDGTELFLDVYLPPEDDAPGLIYAHGGGWTAGGKSGFTRGGVALARAGYAVVAPIYRLAPPGGRWHAPAPVQDLRAALLWYRDNAASFGADPESVGVVGSSAGGNLALLLGTTGEVGRDRADAVVSLSAPIDLLAARRVGPEETATVRNYLGCELTRCRSLWRAMSPLYQVDEDSAPAYLITSESELVPAGQARAMAQALERAGVPVRLDVLAGSLHGLRLAPQVLPEILDFFDEYLAS